MRFGGGLREQARDGARARTGQDEQEQQKEVKSEGPAVRNRTVRRHRVQHEREEARALGVELAANTAHGEGPSVLHSAVVVRL